jgi:hypothetical protein
VRATDLQEAVAHLHAGHADDQEIRIAFLQKHVTARHRGSPEGLRYANASRFQLTARQRIGGVAKSCRAALFRAAQAGLKAPRHRFRDRLSSLANTDVC